MCVSVSVSVSVSVCVSVSVNRAPQEPLDFLLLALPNPHSCRHAQDTHLRGGRNSIWVMLVCQKTLHAHP